MKLTENIEIIVNGKVKVEKPNVITDEGEYALIDNILEKYFNKGFNIIKELSGGNHGEYVMHNEKTHKAACISYKLYYPELVDHNGNRVYCNSYFKHINDINGNTFSFTTRWLGDDKNDTMIRESVSFMHWIDTELNSVEQMKDYVVIN